MSIIYHNQVTELTRAPDETPHDFGMRIREWIDLLQGCGNRAGMSQERTQALIDSLSKL